MLDEANGIEFSNYKDLMQNSRSHSHATTMQASTSAVHYQSHYLFLLKYKVSISTVHIYLSLSISFDMQGVHLSNLLSFALKFTSTRIMIYTSARHIIDPLWIQFPRL